MANWETVIGLEVHVELNTRSKIFCGCATAFGAAPNTQVCPVCLGHPGVLPVLNEQAVEYAVRVGLALGCEIAPYSKFDRKNYVYPDLPKAYQISQYDLPLCQNGHVDIALAQGEVRRVRIRRIHLEEDAGKLLHAGDDIAAAGSSLVDLNRCGVPLIEIVAEPDLRSAEEARLYLEKLRSIIRYTGVSDVKMEEGSLRCDVNVSVRPAGSSEFGTRTELKNVNSFRAVVRGIEFEAARQVRELASGGRIEQETRSWSEARQQSVVLRSKEDAHDYRYFPEPDLPPVVVTPEWRERIRFSLPELPDARRERLIEGCGLPPYDATLITQNRATADWFDAAVVQYGGKPEQSKAVANWMLSEVFRLMNARALEEPPVAPGAVVELLRLIDQGTISGKIAKAVFEAMVETGKAPADIVKEQGLVQVADEDELGLMALRVIRDNPKVVADWRAGKQNAAQFLVGQMMKATRGRANPQLATRLVQEKLKEVTGQD